MQSHDEDILKRVRRIEIKTRGLSDEIFAGKYHTARSHRAHVKVYEEERELTMMLLVDVSPSRMFGSESITKKNLITEVAATLAFSASKNNDKVGCILFSDHIEKFIPPKKGRSHILMIIRELVSFQPTGRGTNLSEALRYLVGVNKKRTTSFLLSDFINAVDDMPKFEDALKIASSKHDLMAINIFDKRDKELPNVGVIEMEDAETGIREWVDTSSRRVREYWQRSFEERNTAMLKMLSHNRVDVAEVETDGDFVVELIKMFKRR